MNDLTGKTALVSGAARGLGESVARAIVRAGGQVLLTDILEDQGRAVAQKLGERARFRRLDVTQAADWERAVQTAEAELGPVSVLVNNAVRMQYSSFDALTEAEFRGVFEVNELGCFLGMKAVLGAMRRAGGGSIVNVSSIAALRGQGGKGQTAYAAAKAGLEGLMNDVADAYGKDGIRVNCVAPGIIDTPMRNQAMLKAGVQPGTIDLTYKVSLPHEGDAWDIARAALFLAGPDGRYITGVMLPVDGGTVARSH